MSSSARQLLEDIGYKLAGVPFKKLKERDLKVLQVSLTEKLLSTLTEKEREVRLNSRQSIVGISTIRNWRKEDPSETFLNLLSQYLDYQNFESYQKYLDEKEAVPEELPLLAKPSKRPKYGNVWLILVSTVSVAVILILLKTANSLEELTVSIKNALMTKVLRDEKMVPPKATDREYPSFAEMEADTVLMPIKDLSTTPMLPSNETETGKKSSFKEPIVHEITISLNGAFENARFLKGGKPIQPHKSGANMFVFSLEEGPSDDWLAISDGDTCRHSFDVRSSKTVSFPPCDSF